MTKKQAKKTIIVKKSPFFTKKKTLQKMKIPLLATRVFPLSIYIFTFKTVQDTSNDQGFFI